MRILVLGSGGREHALAWKLAASPHARVYASPGNPGIAQLGTCLPSDGTPQGFLTVAEHIDADLTIVGPEVPLVAGVVDLFRSKGRLILGPTADAARLEGSKVFAKDFFLKHGIPTARHATLDSAADARPHLARFGFPVVLKADGLAAGKGVVIAHDRAEAEAALSTFPGRLVIEEFLVGEEVSFIALCDGKDVVPLAPTQDHKAVFDGDKGPNTGGMGAYCDSAILDDATTRLVLNKVIYPTVEAMNFTGFLYAGLMMTADGPKVLEYNVRLGDPETQPLMHRLACDFLPPLLAAAEGKLASSHIEWKPGPSVCVVLASGGYPGAYRSGNLIHGLAEAEATGATVFHAGTRQTPAGTETAGGRVLGVTAGAHTLPQAIDAAYRAVRAISFEGMHYRTDIGAKGLKRHKVQ
jgi:phosphoribosylamine---glycine ligase